MSTSFAVEIRARGGGYREKNRIGSGLGEELGQDERINWKLRGGFAPVWICTERWYHGHGGPYFGRSRERASGKPYIG